MIKNYWYNFMNTLFDTNLLRRTHFFKIHIANIFILPKKITSTTIYMMMAYLKKRGVDKEELFAYYQEIENHWNEIETYTFLKNII